MVPYSCNFSITLQCSSLVQPWFHTRIFHSCKKLNRTFVIRIIVLTSKQPFLYGAKLFKDFSLGSFSSLLFWLVGVRGWLIYLLCWVRTNIQTHTHSTNAQTYKRTNVQTQKHSNSLMCKYIATKQHTETKNIDSFAIRTTTNAVQEVDWKEGKKYRDYASSLLWYANASSPTYTTLLEGNTKHKRQTLVNTMRLLFWLVF